MRKVLIIGHAQHGKDTTAEILRDYYGITFESSSQAATKIFIFELLKDKYGYKTPKECFEDRVNHRKEWHDLICEYNKDDKAALAKKIMNESDLYVGMRSAAEIAECKKQGLFDLVIGVFDPRKPLEGKESFDIDLWKEADFVIPNSGTIEELTNRIDKIVDLI